MLPLYQYLYTLFIAAGSYFQKNRYHSYKQKLFKKLSDTVVEIGPGIGVNFAYYPKNIKLICIEPNGAMRPYLKKAARQFGLAVSIRKNVAEKIPLDSNTTNYVVSTFVLCSVDHPKQALDEIKRILKPHGTFIFLEHVAGKKKSAVYHIQKLVNPLWKRAQAGCNINRDTFSAIKNAGFKHIECTRFKTGLLPLSRPHIAGTCRR